ncbi:ribonuclease Z [Candidatus Woesearchaeota archaeon]|nr:MAG: ribonuclease Z [Candidatus Woesearchaeota archaeon]
MIDVVFLGTGSMVPTSTRNHSGVFLRYKDEGLLFDCGEGIQRQLRIAKVSPARITRIFISHWHGDHVLGIPGLIQSMAANHYNRKLRIYGPKGTKEFVRKILNAFICEDKVQMEVVDLKNNDVVKADGFKVRATELKHSATTMAYEFIEDDVRKINMAYLKKHNVSPGPILKKLQQGKDITINGKRIKVSEATTIKKGKKVVFINDTAFCEDCVKAAKGADLLICESTFDESFEEKAKDYMHLTSTQAARIAKLANVKKLILTHFSQRYKSVLKLKNQAKKIFKNVETAKDFLKISL